MGWSRFDDLYDDHPKVMAATHTCPLAATLHAQAITASSRRESDGLVDPFWLLARAPEKRKRTEALGVLVGLRLYDLLPAGEARTLTDSAGFTVAVGPFSEDRHLVHDYLDYNPSSAQQQDRRRKDAERKARGTRPPSAGIPDGIGAESSRNPNGSHGSAGADPQPIPIPSPSQEEHQAPSAPRSRAEGSPSPLTESVECPECRAPAGEQCNAHRGGKRNSYHLKRHHLVGELTHITAKPPAKPAPSYSRPAYRQDPELVALQAEHFPDTDYSTLAGISLSLRVRKHPVTPEAIRSLLEGPSDSTEEGKAA